VQRDAGSTNNIRRRAGRASLGNSRNIDSAPPPGYVVTLSVRCRLLFPAGVGGGGEGSAGLAITTIGIVPSIGGFSLA
jgi:hypothetical protein